MNKNTWLSNVVAIIITFLGTSLIPNFLSNLVGVNVNLNLLAAIVATVVMVFFILVKALIEPKEETQFAVSSKEFKVIRIYAISSRYWVKEFVRTKIKTDNCIILVRGYEERFCDFERYQKELKEAVSIWKEQVTCGNIKKLKIYSYDHIPDHYFTILDEQLLYTGLNVFSQTDSTGQDGHNATRTIASSASDIDKKEIQTYISQFENYEKKYANNIIYDSTTDQSIQILKRIAEHKWYL